jgi:hypothetical protein
MPVTDLQHRPICVEMCTGQHLINSSGLQSLAFPETLLGMAVGERYQLVLGKFLDMVNANKVLPPTNHGVGHYIIATGQLTLSLSHRATWWYLRGMTWWHIRLLL